jgi:hypothetical protein
MNFINQKKYFVLFHQKYKMDISIFTDKTQTPDEEEVQEHLKESYKYWNELREFVLEKYPNAIEEWNYPGKKYGWSFRMKDKKRAIIYLLPREGYFKAAFVFGQKATDKILSETISEDIKNNLENARVYMEGRGIQVEVKDDTVISDIKKLVEIKLAH